MSNRWGGLMGQRLTEQGIVERLQWINELYTRENRLPLWDSKDEYELIVYNWIKNLQLRYKSGKLRKDTLKIIENNSKIAYDKIVGNIDDIWTTNYKAFVQWVNHNVRYPSALRDGEEARLNRWMSNNRRFYRLGKLSTDKIEMINRIHPELLSTNEPDLMLSDYLRVCKLKKHAKNELDALYNKGITKEKLNELIRVKIYSITDIINTVKLATYSRNMQLKNSANSIELREKLKILGLTGECELARDILVNENVSYAVYKTLDSTLNNSGEIRLLYNIFGGYDVIFSMVDSKKWVSQGTFQRIRELVSGLNIRQEVVLLKRYYVGQTYKDIGNDVGVSGSYIGAVDNSIVVYYRKHTDLIRAKVNEEDRRGCKTIA